MDKAAILAAVIQRLEEEMEQAQRSLASTHRAMVDAPTAMQSYSDTTRSQLEPVIGSLKKSVAEKGRAISTLRQLAAEAFAPLDRVRLSAVVRVQAAPSASAIYILLPEAGGTRVAVNDEDVWVITPTSPLATALLGKGRGDHAEFGDGPDRRTLTILEVE
jgi:transcription elongation GreA/GreB family factor